MITSLRYRAIAVVLVLQLAASATLAQGQTAVETKPVSPSAESKSKSESDSKSAKQPWKKRWQRRSGVAKTFRVDPGWNAERFPDHAVCYRSPDEIAAVFDAWKSDKKKPIVNHPRPTDGSLRIVGTGHSFMAPGYKTFPAIAKAAGFDQPALMTHTGGGMTGSARYKWEEENGIFQFDGKPKPQLLSAIANADWDVMMWGPYYNDPVEFYDCWIDFCLQYNPEMKFYLSDAWPQLEHLAKTPKTESELTDDVLRRMRQAKRDSHKSIVTTLNERYDDRVFVLPTSQAMVLAVEYYHRGELPSVEGIHQVVGGKKRSLWRDRLGHLSEGIERLEGYVFYATVYGRSPELIDKPIRFGKQTDYPSADLDAAFRKIAWQAALDDPLSGVIDANRNKIADDRE